MHAVELVIVAHVDDDGQVDIVELFKSSGEARAADAAGDQCDSCHFVRHHVSWIALPSRPFHNGRLMETPDTSNTLAAPTEAPTVVAVVVERRSGDLSDVLRTVGAQVYDPQAVFVVGRDPIGLGDTPVRRVATMAEVLEEIGTDVSYLWIVDQDARPRPDALKALVAGAEQTDAGVAGSKLLRADQPEQLVSVGAATDVFGFPYTGLEIGELDQEQYDVVRDVAFVEPSSVLSPTITRVQIHGEYSMPMSPIGCY